MSPGSVAAPRALRDRLVAGVGKSFEQS